jgi:NitT/TauT family transport system ATP-binding protein
VATLRYAHVSHEYGAPAGTGRGAARRARKGTAGLAPSLALSDVDLSIADGESVALIGPSGCGKSTMLLMAAGLLRPTSGEVLVDGAPQTGPRRQTSLILQNLGLLPWKTVRDNVELGLRLRKVGTRERRERCDRALEGVGLAGMGSKYPAELSGGMRQRVALARSLALDCDLLLMDEPLSALDELLREQIQDMLLDLWVRRGHTQVIVTHSIEEGVFLGRRIVVMTPSPGRVFRTFDNPGVGTDGWRASRGFFELARRVRESLAQARGERDIPAGGVTDGSATDGDPVGGSAVGESADGRATGGDGARDGARGRAKEAEDGSTHR